MAKTMTKTMIKMMTQTMTQKHKHNVNDEDQSTPALRQTQLMNLEQLLEMVKMTRLELDLAVAKELEAYKYSNKALLAAFKATEAAALATLLLEGCREPEKSAYYAKQNAEKTHQAALNSALARDALELYNEAQQKKAEVSLAVKNATDALATVLAADMEDPHASKAAKLTS